MNAVDLGPAPGLVADWISPEAFWLFVLAACVAGAVYVAVTWVRMGRELDARDDMADEPQRVDPHCCAHGHAYRAHQTVWLCVVCGERRPRNAIRWCDEDRFDQDGVA